MVERHLQVGRDSFVDQVIVVGGWNRIARPVRVSSHREPVCDLDTTSQKLLWSASTKIASTERQMTAIKHYMMRLKVAKDYLCWFVDLSMAISVLTFTYRNLYICV